MRGALSTHWSLPLGAVLGSLLAPLFVAVPDGWQLAAAAAVGLACLFFAPLRAPGALVLACCWSLWNFQQRLDDRLPAELAGAHVVATGTITSIPQQYEDFARFRFSPDRNAHGSGLPGALLVGWYREPPSLEAGQRWELDLVLKPPWGRVNFQGPDRERWLFATGIGGLATVRAGKTQLDSGFAASAMTDMRQAVLREVNERVDDPRARGVIRALTLADRSGMSRSDRDLLMLTGTSHLLAISGLHVGLAAAGGILAGRTLGWLLPATFAGGRLYLLAASGGLLAATAYAALAAFGVPTLRSLLMLVAVLSALLVERPVHPLLPWLLAMMAILLLDPFAPLTAGFWLSFTAVAALLILFVPRAGRPPEWRALPMGQAAVMTVMLPLSAMWFQGFSPVGFLANLAAIPWVSFLVVPPVLAGTAALAVSGQAAGLLWSAASVSIDLLWGILGGLARLQGPLTALREPSLAQVALAMVGGVMLLLPRGLPLRWSGVFLVLPLVLPGKTGPASGEVELEVLDTGQGTAVLVTGGGRTLLYDSGPGDGADGNLVTGVIAPALNRLGKQAPDEIVISHGDLDHAGGLATLRERYPEAVYHANVPRVPGLPPCNAPLHRQWAGLQFRILHPTAALPYLGNDSSCVVSLTAGKRRILLSGDISATVERRLVAEGLPAHEFLLVPHHGSKTSSSAEFLAAVSPRVAVATAGLGNRFGFPKPEVEARYRRSGIRMWSTGACGALRFVFRSDGGLNMASARRQRPAIWRWPPAEDCPRSPGR